MRSVSGRYVNIAPLQQYLNQEVSFEDIQQEKAVDILYAIRQSLPSLPALPPGPALLRKRYGALARWILNHYKDDKYQQTRQHMRSHGQRCGDILSVSPNFMPWLDAAATDEWTGPSLYPKLALLQVSSQTNDPGAHHVIGYNSVPREGTPNEGIQRLKKVDQRSAHVFDTRKPAARLILLHLGY